MKSRIVSKSPKVLLSYGIFGNDLNVLLEVAKIYDIAVRQVMPSELNIKVSQLLKVSQLNFETYPLNVPTCILMSGLDKSTINLFLNSLKSNDLNIKLKAVLTSTNKDWSFKTLLEHLELENQRLNNN